MPDYEIEISGKTYELHSDKKMDRSGLERIVSDFRKKAGGKSGSTMTGASQLPPPAAASEHPDKRESGQRSSKTSASGQKTQPKTGKVLPPKLSPFALSGPTTIGPPHATPKPNLLQQAVGALGHVMGLPSGLAASLAMQPVAGHSISEGIHGATRHALTPNAERSDKASVAALQRMNILQRANALSGQSFADPNLGRPIAQEVEGAVSAAHGRILDAPLRTAGHLATDPLAVVAGPGEEVLPAAARVIPKALFAAQGAAGAAEAGARFAKDRSAENAGEVLVNAAMAGLAGKGVSEGVKHNARLAHLTGAIKSAEAVGHPVSPQTIDRLASRYHVNPKDLRAAVSKGAPKAAPTAPTAEAKPEERVRRRPVKPERENPTEKRERVKEKLKPRTGGPVKHEAVPTEAPKPEAKKPGRPKEAPASPVQPTLAQAVDKTAEAAKPQGSQPRKTTAPSKPAETKTAPQAVSSTNIKPEAKAQEVLPAKPNTVEAKPTEKPNFTITPDEAATLGTHFTKGHPVGDMFDKFARSKKLTEISDVQADAIRELIEKKKLDKTHFPSLYPDAKASTDRYGRRTGNKTTAKDAPLSAKDKALQDKGPQELHAGINPLELLEKAKQSHGGQAVGDIIYGDKTSLTQESRKGLESVNKHENARTTAGLDADRVLPPVTSHLSAEDRARFGAYGVADRLLAEKREAQDIVTKASARRRVLLGDVRKAQTALDAAVNSRDIQAIRKAQDVLKEARSLSNGHLKAIADAKKAIRENALERAASPHSVTLPNGTKEVIKESDIAPFFARPEIAQSLAAHKVGGEAMLHSNQQAQGNKSGISVGYHTKSYFPAAALDDTGALRKAAGSRGGRHQAAATMAQNTAAKEFQGNAYAYESDYNKYMRDAMKSSYGRATERQMYQTLMSEGLMSAYDPADTKQRRTTDGKLEVEYKGKWEPATDFSIQKYGARDDRLPDRVVMPSRIYRELQPMFEPHVETLADQLSNTAMHHIMQTYLLSPADAVQHSAALGSRAAYGAARASSPTDSANMQAVKQAGKGMIAPMQSAVNFVRFWNPNLYPEALRSEAVRHMSEAGVLPSDFGDTGKKEGVPAPKNLLDRKNWTLERAKHPGHNVLYGDRGVLSNAGTAVYKAFKDTGALSTPEGVEMMHQAMRETFNTYSKTDRAALASWSRAALAGSFYQTGLKNRTAAVSAGKHVYLASLASRALLTIGAVQAVTGKKPWEIPGYKWGYLPIYKDSKTGEVIMADARVFDRVGFYPDQIVHSLAQNSYDVTTKKTSARAAGWQVAADVANWSSAPVTSGPGPQVGGTIMGKAPFLVPNKTLSGLDIIDHPAVKLGMTPKRALAVAGSAVPLFLVLSIDPAHEMTASAPKSDNAQKINWWLRKVGAPQLRSMTPEKTIEKRRKAQETGAKRVDAKAEGRTPPATSRGRSSGSLFGGRSGGL